MPQVGTSWNVRRFLDQDNHFYIVPQNLGTLRPWRTVARVPIIACCRVEPASGCASIRTSRTGSQNLPLIERPGGSRAVNVRSPVPDCSTGPFDDAFRVPKIGRITAHLNNQIGFRRVFGIPECHPGTRRFPPAVSYCFVRWSFTPPRVGGPNSPRRFVQLPSV